MNVAEITQFLSFQDLKEFERETLLAYLHYEDIVDSLVRRETNLQTALARIPKAKQEWLTYVGLYPYDADAPMVIAMEYLLKAPAKFRETVVRIIDIFWKNCFKQTWEQLKSQLQRSAEEKERLFHSCSFDEFARQALLRIHVDEKKQVIEAVRGGFKLEYRNVAHCYFIPSAFNDRRYWTALITPNSTETYVYFPYFDPSIVLEAQLGPDKSYIEPELDPAMIFKALGDSTRYAIASMIARQPTSSVELAKRLCVSKPTISHHVTQLREAGLILEEYRNGCVYISLRRDVLERLSEVTVRKLFDSQTGIDLMTSRKRMNPG